MDQDLHQPPETVSAAALATADMRVEGKYLVVQSGATLPQLCVKTGVATQQQDNRHQRLSWCPPIVGLLIVLSGLLMILIYFIARKHCTITFSLSSDVRKKYRNRCIFKVIAVIVLFFVLPFASIESTPVFITAFVLFLVAVISLFVGNSPLAIAKHRKGEFWISGCSKEFLSHIQAY